MKNVLCLSTATLCIAVSLFIAGCDLNPQTDGSTSGGNCSANGYGYVQFSNKSSTNQDYYIYWDNKYLGTVKPGATEPQNNDYVTTKEGNHELIFKFTSDAIACGPQTVTLKKCEYQTYTCSN